jgi:hypothetical protein
MKLKNKLFNKKEKKPEVNLHSHAPHHEIKIAL